jgi:hypothetical protein
MHAWTVPERSLDRLREALEGVNAADQDVADAALLELRQDLRKNAIEALNRQLRRAIKTKGHFANKEGRQKTHLPRHRESGPGVDPNSELDDSAAGIQDPLGDRSAD